MKYPNGYVVVACPVSLQYFPPKSYAYHLVLPVGDHIYMISHTARAYRPVCLCAHTGRARAYRPRIPAAYTGRCAHTHIPAVSAHTGCVYRPVCSYAPTGRCAYARIPKWYTRAFRPMCTWRVCHPTMSILLFYSTHTNVLPRVCALMGFCTVHRGPLSRHEVSFLQPPNIWRARSCNLWKLDRCQIRLHIMSFRSFASHEMVVVL